MKTQICLVATCLCATFFFLCGSIPHHLEAKWKLVWEDDFKQQKGFDTATWSKIPRGTADWQNFMSDNDVCYGMENGNLILRGIVNPDRSLDTATYLTGGLYTKGKHAFYGGRLEIKAKLQGATGAWPAIWLLPFDTATYHWPTGGEIDIMERLNRDSIAYQTVHSGYTYIQGIKDTPPQGGIGSIAPDDFNIYAVEMYPDSLVFFINNLRTFAYPRIKTDKEGQYPFDIPYYLLIDMQLGGSWVGGVDSTDLPVEMQVDWVRHYQKD